MSELDPENEDPSPAGPQDSQSSDQSKSKLRAAWDGWTSRPENNAALLQFGLAMLQPRAPGQSGVGQFANAVGQGAEASDRNIATQQAAETQQSNIESKKSEASARTTTAQAYADQVRQGGAKGDKAGMQGALRQQADFRKWLAKPEDTTGMTIDPIVGSISKQFPEVKSKADLLNNPPALAAARKMFSEQIAEPDEDTAPATAPSPGASPPVTTAPTPVRRYNAQGKGVEWNGKQWIPIN